MIPGDKSCYPGSDVLVNKFDIRDADTAKAVEYKFASVRELEMAVSPIHGSFDISHLQAIHHHLFQDMYDWAGVPRKIDFAKRSKQTGYISRFIPASVMDIKAEDFNRFMAEKNQLKGLTKPEFVKAITEVHTKLNELHPFREGNGRSTRIFLEQLAKEAGYELNMEAIEKDRWNLASHKAMVQIHPKEPDVKLVPNQSDMRQIFHEALKPTREHAFTYESRENAVKLHPDLKVAYARMDAMSRAVEKLPDQKGAERVLEAERARIGNKLREQTAQDDRVSAIVKLRNEQNRIGPSTPGSIDQYELVVKTMVDVLKGQNRSGAEIKLAEQQAREKMGKLKEAGIPAPKIQTFDREAARTVSRPGIERAAEAGKDKGGPRER